MYIDVDSGQIWIGDPCYILPRERTSNPGLDYEDLIMNDDNYPPSGVAVIPHRTFKECRPGKGILLSNFDDGSYRVTVSKDAVSGRPVAVTVHLNYPIDTDEVDLTP